MHSCPLKEPAIYPLTDTTKTALLSAVIAARGGGLEVNRPRADTPGRNASDDLNIPTLDPGSLPITEECVDNWTTENTTVLNSAHYLTDTDLSILVWGIEQVKTISHLIAGESREEMERECEAGENVYCFRSRLPYTSTTSILSPQLYDEQHRVALFMHINSNRLQ